MYQIWEKSNIFEANSKKLEKTNYQLKKYSPESSWKQL
jgi:hypothetical protein